VDALARDALALLAVLDGLGLDPAAAEAAALLATVTRQDLEENPDGRFRIARRVAPDRVIFAADPRPGTAARPPRAGSTAIRATSVLSPTASW
jgi:hypothetical protein